MWDLDQIIRVITSRISRGKEESYCLTNPLLLHFILRNC